MDVSAMITEDDVGHAELVRVEKGLASATPTMVWITAYNRVQKELNRRRLLIENMADENGEVFPTSAITRHVSEATLDYTYAPDCDTRMALGKAWGRLPEPQRQALWLSCQGYTLEEMAVAMGESYCNAAKLLSLGRKALRKRAGLA